MKAFSFTFMLLLLVSVRLTAQPYVITGRVTDSEKPLTAVNIHISERNAGTVTTAEGYFSLWDIPNGLHKLKITCIGYVSQEVEVEVDGSNVKVEDVILKEDYLMLNQVVVSTNRNEILRLDAPIVCNVLDDKILSSTQSVTLAEGLSFQPALRMESNCQNCGFSSLRMNGLEGAYSQILIDGRPIFNSLQGVYGLEQIPSNMVERVEVVRSGGSALYGSSAVAGTVNIITKEPRKNSYYATTNQSLIDGSIPDRVYLMGADVINEDRDLGFSLHAFNRSREFWDSNGDGFSEIGQIKSTSFNVKAFYKPSKYSKLILNGYNIYEFRRGGNDFDKAFHETDITESTTHRILNGGVTYEQYTSNEKHKFSLYANAQKLDRDSYYGSGEDENAYGFSKDRSTVSGVQYSGNLGGLANGTHTLVSGFEYTTNELTDNAPSYNRYIAQKINQLGIYLQDMWVIKRWNVLVGGRIDNHSLITGPIFSPRTNILYKITPDLQFRLGYARGFRAPQVFDEDLHISQVGGEGLVVVNEPNLSPEFSNAFSTSLDFNRYSKNWAIGFTLDAFYTRLSDVFVLEDRGSTSDGSFILERRNGSGAKVAGVTLNPKIQYRDAWNIQFGMTLQRSNFDSPVQWSESVTNARTEFFRTPNTYGFYVMSWDATKHLSLNLSGVYTGRMWAPHYAGYIEEDRLQRTPAFLENNLKVEYTFIVNSEFNFILSGGVQNYTNAYQTDFDLGVNRDSAYIYGPIRPRTFFMALNLNLN